MKAVERKSRQFEYNERASYCSTVTELHSKQLAREEPEALEDTDWEGQVTDML